MIINTAVENSTPTTKARARNRLKEMHSVKNSATSMAKTNVSMMADIKIAFFLFMF